MQNQQTGQGNLHQVNQAMMNHGGHELFDVHEVLSSAIGALDMYTILKPHIKDQELLNILERQYQFMVGDYNTLVDCFKTGKDPKVPTQTYSMTQGNNFTYGIQPGQPKKPIQSANELTDECISGWMLGLHKQGATGKVSAALESTNPVVRRVLADSIPNCIEMAYELSIYQNKHQYYQVPQLSQHDMNAIVNSYAETQSPGMQH